ncbi:hypothetical protein AVEN_248795-1, partial [Araneus ventricosus]
MFGTREGKNWRQGRKLVKLEQMIRNGGIPKNLKSKTQSADSNLRPRYEDSGKTKDLPTSAPRAESEKLGKAFTDVPKFVQGQGSKSTNSLHPDSFLFPTRGISSFISSLGARCR